MNTRSPVARFPFSLGTKIGSFLALVAFLLSAGVQAQVAEGFSDVVIFATNSVDIKDESQVLSGEVVVNDASPGPTLVSGVELNVRKKVKAVTLRADSIAIAGGAVISGDVHHNDDLTNGGTIQGSIFALIPPVFDSLPAFMSGDQRPQALDVIVAAGGSVDLHAGDYRDIVVGAGGIVVFTGGIYNILSITGSNNTNLVFQAPSEVRVAERFKVGKTSMIGDPNVGVSAGNIIFYVEGFNGQPSNPSSKPAAVDFGDASLVAANFYAPNGRIHFRKATVALGAFLARDVHVDKNVQLTLDSFFANRPPTAFTQDVSMGGSTARLITLEGSDPEGGTLTFSINVFPTPKGVLGSITQLPPTSASVTYEPFNPGLEETDNFIFEVTDPGGLTDTATVQINPPGDPTPPVAPIDEVVANDQLCDSIDPIDCSLETVEGTAITLVLTGAAPCEEVSPPEAVPCDGNGNDVPLFFSLPSTTTSQGGTLSGLDQGTGQLQEPPGADEVPQRTASVVYTPPTGGFTGIDSFVFDVEGDVDDSGGIDPSAEPNLETDTATVEISVQTFTPIPPVEARDQMVSTEAETPVDINLSGGAGSCDPNDPDCRQESPPEIQAQPPGQRLNRSAGGKVVDETGSAVVQWHLTGAHARKSAVQQRSQPGNVVMAAGERLFGIDSDLDQLFEVSPDDATSTLIGSTAAGPTTPASLAFDGTTMFTIDLGGGGLYKLNLNTGAPALVCSTGISGWQGVASDPTDEGQFYGITQSDDLYKIDRTTCITTRVNATAGTVGGLIAALEFDANGTLWGAEFGSPGSTTQNAALVTIDKTTGAVTVVSQCATKPCSGSDNFADGFQGIDFSTDGTLYGQNTNDDSLYIIDTTDGSLTFIGSNATIFVKGLAFSEEVPLQPGFTVLTLPAVGTLSYINPDTGVTTNITAGDLPLLLPTEQVTYTPPAEATGQPLASFTFEQSDGITSDSGLIQLFVSGFIIVIDECALVGRPPGCDLS